MSSIVPIEVKRDTSSIIRSWIVEMNIKTFKGKLFSLVRAYEYIVEDFAEQIKADKIIYSDEREECLNPLQSVNSKNTVGFIPEDKSVLNQKQRGLKE